jgi:hypothetical protein
VSKKSAVTIVARNYLAQAKVLAESFLRTNPDSQFFTLIIDGSEDHRYIEGLRGQVLLPSDVLPDERIRHRMETIYGVMEYATALKPKCLEYLLSEFGGFVLYLDPDIQVFAQLDGVFEELNSKPIAFTPHTLEPVPRDGLETSEETLRLAGIFNLGFIGVSQQAMSFLGWWHERLMTDAVVDLEHALFTDQKWIDFVPSLFDFISLADPGLNVAYWNLHERRLDYDEHGVPNVNGFELKFFHFSGFDPLTPWILTKHAGPRPRVAVADSHVLRHLCDHYASLLLAQGHLDRKSLKYSLDVTPSGLPLSKEIRRFYREEWTEALKNGGDWPPNPFSEPTDFHEWAFTPLFGIPGHRISRFERSIWSNRLDLRRHFPDIEAGSSPHFRFWLKTDHDVQNILNKVRAFEIPDSPLRNLSDGGWNMIGYFSAELGVGEAGRRLADMMTNTGRPIEFVGLNAAHSRQKHRIRHEISDQVRFRNSIIAVNADQTHRAVEMSGLAQHPRGRRIGYWFWELEDFPKIWMKSFDLLDEVWCASEFVRDSLQTVSPIPISLVRLPIEDLAFRSRISRAEVGLSDDFTFLFTYDFNSVLKRKNPLDVVEAYCKAFGPSDGARLVLKSINGHLNPSQLALVRYHTQFRSDISVQDGYFPYEKVQAQIEHADCFVSLHRSEGFGLNIASAIAAGRPVIATSYSGNMTFTPVDYPYLVPYTKVQVGPGADPYPKEAYWAQPEIDFAANLMRQVFDNPGVAAREAATARSSLLESHSLKAVLADFNASL